MDAIDTEIRRLEDRFPGFANLHLWKLNVFRGETLLDHAKKGVSIMAADVSTQLLRLQELGVIKAGKFNPSTSQGAFIGLQYTNVKAPCPGTAHAFEWEVVDGSIEGRLAGLLNPATRLGEMF